MCRKMSSRRLAGNMAKQSATEKRAKRVVKDSKREAAINQMYDALCYVGSACRDEMEVVRAAKDNWENVSGANQQNTSKEKSK